MKPDLTQAEMAVLLRHDFNSFIQRCFIHLNPETPYHDNWHIDLIAAKLEACRAGKCRRLIINVPPRSLKSICTSIAYPAWILAHQPAAQIVCASYGQDLSDKLAQDTRSIMMSDWYQALFATRLVGGRPSVSDFRTTRGGGRLATSVGGVLTGRGADIIIIDDPLKPDEALSDTQRQNVNNWFDHTVLSRLNNKKTGCVIMIMQRLHLDDLVGHVIGQDDWEVVSLPSIAEKNETFTADTIFGERIFTRTTGDLLHPARESVEELDNLRTTLGEYHFAGQYQQSPVPMGGGLVKEAWLRYYEVGEALPRFAQIVQSWDTANKESELCDYSVCTTWGVSQSNLYLLDVVRRRMDFPDLKRAVMEQSAKHRPTVILIEDKASGTQLIQELRASGISTIKAVKPEGNKTMRMNAQTSKIEGGFVFLPIQAHWLAAYQVEITTFPHGKFDDQVDSTSQALGWIQLNGVDPGLLQYYRELQ